MKSGHPVLGIVLGIMGIGIALTLTVLTGVVGGGVALLLGLLALILGVKASKGGARIGSILVGVVFGWEEYETNAGEVKQRLYLKSCKTADQIRQGDFTVPAFKPLSENKKASKPGEPPAGFTALTDDDIPF